ncbi:hypothetical protein GCM10009779_67270 [Polymorphospora rubra]|uniref:Uncharacterized protein n=2 Tax=Polymorphospora rubra TaxID=338584 RepID=A0A810MUG1_9ACTN|nr:hypothetical protein Prubr_03240 [Polymorphospora rubra]
MAAMTDTTGRGGAERRVWGRLPDGARDALTDGLAPADLRTALLDVARTRAAAVRPADLLRRWRDDRFVRPADSDPRVLAEIEARLWRLLPAEFDGVELSPVVPLGTCSAVAPVSQDRIVATVRATEVVSDATNALAVEAAVRRRRQPVAGAVHLAASHRHLRAQLFGPGTAAHFRLFTLVSSARDTGSGRTEAALLARHLAYWRRVLAALPTAAAPRLRYTVLDDPVVAERVGELLPGLAAAGGVDVVEEPDRERGRGYYVAAALRLTARDGTGPVELGDGGFTGWTALLTGDAKERCLISCLSTERFAALAGGPR